MREITPIIFLIRYGVSDFLVTNYQVTIHLLNNTSYLFFPFIAT